MLLRIVFFSRILKNEKHVFLMILIYLIEPSLKIYSRLVNIESLSDMVEIFTRKKT